MITINQLSRIKNINGKDLISIFPFVVAVALSPFFKKKNKTIWMISDREDEAADNGYSFYKYLRNHQIDQGVVFVIDPNCGDYEKVASLGKVIPFGSLKHWILYLTCQYNISSQGGQPNSYLCTFLEKIGLIRSRNIFLQHGITKDYAEYLLPDRRYFETFFAGAKPEFDYVSKEFGYKPETVQYTGFSRFDDLQDFEVKKNRILIMPTWRAWLKLRSVKDEGLENSIDNSEYLSAWTSFINSPRLEKLIKEYGLEVIFFPHSNFQPYLSKFSTTNDHVVIASKKDYSVQELLKTSEMLITDYSSVFFDMAYMKKMSLFYQFDEEKYRKSHYKEGWFDYHTTAIGKIVKAEEELIDALEEVIKNSYRVNDDFIVEHHEIFTLYDSHNSERIFRYLQSK
ncbi:TPA: CDP-glycerol glycerophosphotransferase family protein [Streptococcus suis]